VHAGNIATPLAEPAGPAAPRVSILIAAHNRSNVLKLAIDSIRAQDVTDWELWVGCDGCTDDSPAVAAGYDDPRIRVVVFEPRIGDQFRVANALRERCRGDVVAYLNQDDLWFPDHLSRALLALNDSDLYLGRIVTLLGNGPQLGPAHYDPREHYPMSSRVLRRTALEAIGPYPDPLTIIAGSADAWLFRAWRRGLRMRVGSVLTVIKINSVLQPGSYRRRPADLHEDLMRQGLGEPLRQRLLAEAERRQRDAPPRPPRWRRRSLAEWRGAISEALRHRLIVWLQALSMPFGVPPQSVSRWIRGQRRGDFQRALNRQRGSD
jgi:glycosyltransferase involved in cell wall biosynthesis